MTTTILIIIASAASYLLGAAIAAGARADLEAKNIILRDTLQTIITQYTTFQLISPKTLRQAQQTLQNHQYTTDDHEI